MRARLGYRLNTSPLAWMAFSSVTKHFVAVHMTFGAMNEWAAQAGYSRLLQIADHPVLSTLLRRIMKQEGRHVDYYRSEAVTHLDTRAAQRTTRALARALWSPVGAKAMPLDDTRHMISTLFGGADGREMVERLDRRVDQLPGLAGLHLMRRACATYSVAS
jgi:hypothetical protein